MATACSLLTAVTYWKQAHVCVPDMTHLGLCAACDEFNDMTKQFHALLAESPSNDSSRRCDVVQNFDVLQRLPWCLFCDSFNTETRTFEIWRVHLVQRLFSCTHHCGRMQLLTSDIPNVSWLKTCEAGYSVAELLVSESDEVSSIGHGLPSSAPQYRGLRPTTCYSIR